MIIGGLKLAPVEEKWPCSSALRPQLTLFSTFHRCHWTHHHDSKFNQILFFAFFQENLHLCVHRLSPAAWSDHFQHFSTRCGIIILEGRSGALFSAVREKWCRIVLINLVKVENYAKLSKLEAKRTRKMSSKLNCELSKYSIWMMLTRDMIHEEVQNRRQPVLSSKNGRFNK